MKSSFRSLSTDSHSFLNGHTTRSTWRFSHAPSLTATPSRTRISASITSFAPDMFTKEQIWEGLPNGDDAAHTHLCAQLQQIFEEFQLRERSLYGTQQPILISILAQRIPQFPRFVQDTYARNPGGTMHALFELACTEKRESWKAHFANFDLPDHTPEPDSNTIIFNGFTNVFVVSQMEMNYGHVKNFNLNEFKPDHYYSPTGVTVVLETLDFDKFEYELRINLGYDRNRHDIAYVVTGSRPGEPSRRWVRVQTREQWIVAILQLKGVGEYTVRRIPKFPEIKFSIIPIVLPPRLSDYGEPIVDN